MMRCSPSFQNILSDIFKNRKIIYGSFYSLKLHSDIWGVMNYEDQTDYKWVYSNCKQQIIH